MHPKKFSLTDRIKSFKYAWNGLVHLIKNEHNARIHVAAAILAVILGLIFDINRTDWIIVVFAIGFVFVTELFNTAIEEIADFIEPKQDNRIATIKDCAAAAVLISSIAAFIVALIIFTPKIIDTFSSYVD